MSSRSPNWRGSFGRSRTGDEQSSRKHAGRLKGGGMEMTVRVRLFAFMAQAAGMRDAQVEVAPGATLSDVQQALMARLPELRWPRGVLWAVNQEYATSGNVRLKDGDEVAIIPPVSGG